MAAEAIAEAAGLIKSSFGDQYWAGRYKHHDKKVAGAQEAHECIRPTAMSRPRREVEAEIRAEGGRDSEAMARVYDLVWKRTVASLMSRRSTTGVGRHPGHAPSKDPVRFLFRATGSTLRFDGFIRIYLEGATTRRRPRAAFPALTVAQALRLLELRPEEHFTQPPPRYTEASLVKELEERRIGRPSTYAFHHGDPRRGEAGLHPHDNRRFKPTDTGR